MTGKKLGEYGNSAIGRYIRQTYDSRMAQAFLKNKTAKISVNRYQDSLLASGNFQQLTIAGIGTDLASFNNVVPSLSKPCRQAPARATIDQESHGLATSTKSSESWAITACAYARQARMSSISRSG